MFHRFEKITAIVQFSFDYVNIRRKLNNKFNISFSRGNFKGTTKICQPNSNGVIKFDESFETKCNFYVSRSDGDVRSKMMRIKLHKVGETSKIYGRTSFDLGPYLGNTNGSILELEMETGRSIAPVLQLTLKIIRLGNSVLGNFGKNDQSFVEEEPQKIPISEWDRTEISASSDDEKNEEKQTKEDNVKNEVKTLKEGVSKKEKQVKEEGVSKNEGQVKEEGVGKNEKQVKEESAKNEEKQSNESDVKKEVKPAKEKNTKKKKIRRVRQNRMVNLPNSLQHEIKVTEEEDEEQPKKGINKRISKSTNDIRKMLNEYSNSDSSDIPELVESQEQKNMEIMKDILKATYIQAQNVYISPKIEFPAAVFPIYGFILHSNFLMKKTSEDDFKIFIDEFDKQIDTAPFVSNCRNDTRFLTLIVLYLLIKNNPKKQQIYGDYQKRILDLLHLKINAIGNKILAPHLKNFDVLCNRFLSGNFEVDSLLSDFCQVLDVLKLRFNFSPVLNEYLYDIFLSVLDLKIANKLLSNPSKFIFSKAVVWNSFISLFEQTKGHQLTYTREIILTMIMAPNLSSESNKNKELIDGICPNLDPKVILFVLKNMSTDEMMQSPIDIKPLAKEFHVYFISNQFDPLKQILVPIDFDTNNDFKINLWTRAVVLNTLREFPFLRKYIPKKKST